MRLIYLSYSKWCPSATIHIWTRDCTSRCTLNNMAQASVIRFRSSCHVGGGVAYTRCLMYQHRKKSNGFRSGECGGHFTQPAYLILVVGICPECTVGHLIPCAEGRHRVGTIHS
ncbi:hypothetical protein AVEN_255206-1 [Araneus ventricosus]|uniref:Uncharacterized protein n=1 Tax=Araneus ventricosus TaxID=182803 RepID=A0A4Y2BCQ3_ARAVE|nr:hypothetical protein AVEN_255206-1 [Araneus ventricosus]